MTDELITWEVARRRSLYRMFISLGFITMMGFVGVIGCFYIDSWWPFIITAIMIFCSLVWHARGDARDRKRTVHR